MKSAGAAVVVSEPLFVSDQQVTVINPSHLQVIRIVRISRAGEHLHSEEAVQVTDFDCCDVIIDNQGSDGPSDGGEMFAIWGVNYRTAHGTRIRSPQESCKQHHHKGAGQSCPDPNDPTQPTTRQTLRAAEGDEERGQENSEEHNRNNYDWHNDG
jgi:hypothetical protein